MIIERSLASVTLVAESGQKAKKIDNERPAKQPSVITDLHFGQSSSAADVDMVKVNQIREALANGTLTFNPERIADKLIQSLRELA
ncbi:flagellar biosynthesis anti-sigma factor FlgM (plasmid) [Pseudomonas silesiensis]|uniref:flagellar biosynthesis anti-sigma factor FlgM n=1 Tax=Pseudomonas silesiensis TaxID=1853130 RepID=UPI0030CD0933